MRKECIVDGCTNPRKGRGYCAKHYARYLRNGDALKSFKKIKSTCKVEGCDKNVQANGYCEKHNRRMLKYGDHNMTYIGREIEHHGMTDTSEYRSWYAMRRRCNNKNNKAYSRYGGRGIKVCEEWNTSFISFYKDMGPKPYPGAHIDRINNDGDYELGNCRWVDARENNQNRRSNKLTKKQKQDVIDIGNNTALRHCDIAKLFNISRSRVTAILKEANL